MKYKEFPNMVEIIPEVEGKRFKIEHFELSEEFVKMEKLGSVWNIELYRDVYGLEAGKYIRLIDKEKNEIVMSNTWMEEHTNISFVNHVNGNVLIAGLGIGMIILAIQDYERVKTITVIEKEKEIIDMIEKHLPLNDKVKLINADIFAWKPDNGTKYDTIYFDIWNNISCDNYPEMKKLHRKFCRMINRENPKHYMESWRKNDCRG